MLLDTEVLVENDGADSEIVRIHDALLLMWKHRLILQHTPLITVEWSAGFTFSRQSGKRVSVHLTKRNRRGLNSGTGH